MEIIFLGSGTLSNPLKNFLSATQKVKILPLKKTNLEYFENFSKNFSSNKVIFDLMDPNKIDSNTDLKLLSKASHFRKIVAKSNFIKQYIYFSSANLYSPSHKIISEKSNLIQKTNSDYLSLKRSSELFLKDFNLPLSICRLPNVWGHEAPNSFFSDLMISFKKGDYIDYRDGDDEVISYLNINDLGYLLLEILKKEYLGVINLSTDSFNSRQNLKAKVNKDEYRSINRNLGIRLTSEILDWKKIFRKSELPL